MDKDDATSSRHQQYLQTYTAHLRHTLAFDPAYPRALMTEVGVGYWLWIA
jgi:hypothetical protein